MASLEYFTTAIKGIVALALALAPMLAAADTVYKYRRPDGKVVYSDVPLRGAKLIGRFELVPLPPSAASAGNARGDAARSSADVSGRAERRISALDAADAAIKAAGQ